MPRHNHMLWCYNMQFHDIITICNFMRFIFSTYRTSKDLYAVS
uniref:Uncharacterized protein n=1 Tax=Arundo donax TaxID=35708 RepID=A0A0A9HA38_ARUDO